MPCIEAPLQWTCSMSGCNTPRQCGKCHLCMLPSSKLQRAVIKCMSVPALTFDSSNVNVHTGQPRHRAGAPADARAVAGH
jgi:hypothetical protein